MAKGKVMSNAAYRQIPAVSSTDLKKLAKSPLHYQYYKTHPTEDTPALLFGRASHKYMLEKAEFEEEFAVCPSVNRRTKEGKAEYEQFIADNLGKDVIAQDDFDKILEMHKALYSTPFVGQLLSGKKELSYFWKDLHTNVDCKCRPDCLTKIGDTVVLIDYKTCDDASTDRFMKRSIDLMYDLQMAFYKDGLIANGIKVDSVMFIAQEKNPPYAVNIMEVTPEYLASGSDMYHTYLNLYKECTESDVWFGYTNNEVNSLQLPGWLLKQYQN